MELRRAVVRAVGPRRLGGVDPATRTFQALRIAVNGELDQLISLLAIAKQVLAPGGVAAIISFHSLEDRLGKQFIRSHSELDPVLAKLPVIPSGVTPPLRRIGNKQRPGADEIAANARSRSAVLRIAQRQA